MSYIEESIINNERVVEIFKFHWMINLIITIHFIISILTIGVWLIVAIPVWLYYKYIEQGVTTNRVIHKSGIISRNTKEMKLTAVESVYINQGILGRILGFGTVTITGRGISDIKMSWLDNPMSVKRRIENSIEEASN